MKKILLLAIALLMMISSSFAISEFPDVQDGEWYASWVSFIKELKITSGYPGGTFRPQNKVTRIEMLSFTMKSLNHDIPVNKNGYWGQNIIDVAISEKIIDGDSLIARQPQEFISREETAHLIYSAYLKKNSKISADIQNKVRKTISDISSVNSIFEEGVIGLVAIGVVEGYEDKTFRPKNQLTRAEASVFISRLALPDKRLTVVLDFPTFEYKTTSFRASNFTVQYDPVYQDIYNILSILDEVVNEDVTHGFVAISPLGGGNGHSSTIYPSMKELDEATAIELTKIGTWAINVTRNPVDLTIKKGEIQIFAWRDPNETEHTEGVLAVVKYLFGSEYMTVWNKLMEYHSSFKPGTWTETINGRKVIIHSSGVGILLNTSRIDNVKKINPSDFK